VGTSPARPKSLAKRRADRGDQLVEVASLEVRPDSQASGAWLRRGSNVMSRPAER
jgi:hypothetical protein